MSFRNKNPLRQWVLLFTYVSDNFLHSVPDEIATSILWKKKTRMKVGIEVGYESRKMGRSRKYCISILTCLSLWIHRKFYKRHSETLTEMVMDNMTLSGLMRLPVKVIAFRSDLSSSCSFKKYLWNYFCSSQFAGNLGIFPAFKPSDNICPSKFLPRNNIQKCLGNRYS